MAAIEEKDLISDGALERPLKLAKSLDSLEAALRKVLNAAQQSSQAIESAKTTSKVTDESKKLAQAQAELTKIQEKAAKTAQQYAQSQAEVAKSIAANQSGAVKMSNVLNSLDVANLKAANSATALGKATQDSATSAKAAQQVYQAEAGTLESLIQKRQRMTNAIDQQKKIQAEDADLLKRGTISRAEYNQRITESNAVIAKNQAGIQNLSGQIKNHILLNGNLSDAYKKLTIQLEAARAKYKDMAASGTATTAQLKAQEAAFNSLNAKVTAIDKTVGQFQRNVGNYPTTFAAATAGITRFLAAFGLVSGVVLFAKALKDLVTINAQFEQSNSRLQGILGANKADIAGLTAQQIKLGQTTLYTAKQYSELQIELAKLGFPIADIKEMTQSTSEAALAMGSGLGEQAELTGTTLRAFQLTAADTTKVNDQLSKATATTALDFNDLATALPYVATNAKLLGFSLEETLALMGQLSNTGLNASTIGTSLRSIFLKLADSTSALSKQFKTPVRDLPTLIAGLKQLRDSGTDLGEALELTDKRAVSAFTSLIAGAGNIEELSATIRDADGFTKQLAKTVSDNLAGDFKLFTSAVSSLAQEIGEVLNGSLRTILQALTQFVYILKGLPQFLNDNKVLIIGLTIALVSFKGAAIQANVHALLLQFNMLKFRTAAQAALVSTRAFGASLLTALGPLGLVLLSLGAIVSAIGIYDSNSKRAQDVTARNTELNKGLATNLEQVSKAQKSLNVSVDDWLAKSEDQKKSLIEQQEFTVKLYQSQLESLKIQKVRLQQSAAELTLGQKIKSALLGPAFGAKSAFEDSLNNQIEATEGITDKIKELETEIGKLSHIYDDDVQASKSASDKKTKELTDAEKKRLANIKKAQLELEKFRLERQIKGLDEIANNENQSESARLAATIEAEKKRADLALVENKYAKLGKIKGDADLVQIDEEYQAKLTDNTKQGAINRDTIQKQSLEKQLKDAADNAKQTTERVIYEANIRRDAAIDAVEAEVLSGNKTRQRGDREINQIKINSEKEILKITIDSLKAQLQAERDIYYAGKKRLIEDSEMSEVDKIAALKALYKQSAKEQIDTDNQIHEAQNKLNDLTYQSQIQWKDKTLSVLQQVQQAYQEFSQSIINLLSAQSQARIQNIDAEIKKTQDFYDQQITLAGDNDDLKKVIEAREAARLKKLNDDKIKEQRRQAKFEKAQAIASATIAGAVAFVSALPNYILAAIVAASTAIQIAAIVATPLPAYADGVASHPGGLAVVGDGGGSELVKTAYGNFLTPSTPTVMSIPKGAEVLPDYHPETMREIAMRGIKYNYANDRQESYGKEIVNELKGVTKAVRGIKPQSENFVANGNALYRVITSEGKRNTQILDFSARKWK